jgi:hypothetical protein
MLVSPLAPLADGLGPGPKRGGLVATAEPVEHGATEGMGSVPNVGIGNGQALPDRVQWALLLPVGTRSGVTVGGPGDSPSLLPDQTETERPGLA